MTLRRLFWTIAVSALDQPIFRSWFQWIWMHMIENLPVIYLRKTETLLAFHHPNPNHPVHILLVPKRSITNMNELTESDSQFLVDLFACVRSLVDEFGLAKKGYRLIANGGVYQEVPQLHFHLISEAS